MSRALPFFMLFVPIMEIAVFIVVGQWIGVLPTIILIILTALLGAALLRHQGVGLALKLRGEMEAGRVPGRELADGAMMLVAGVLLLVPGFVTDTLGLLLFVPQLRARVFDALSKRLRFTASATTGHSTYRAPQAGTIDLGENEYQRDDAEHETGTVQSQNGRSSPWTTID